MENKLVYIKCPIDFWGYDNEGDPVIVISEGSTITTETLKMAENVLSSYEELIIKISATQDLKKRKYLFRKAQEEFEKAHSINIEENSTKKR